MSYPNIFLVLALARVARVSCALGGYSYASFGVHASGSCPSSSPHPLRWAPSCKEPGTYGVSCSFVPYPRAGISLVFTSDAGAPFALTIPGSELSVGPFPNDPSTCQMQITAQDPLPIIGASLFKHYYTVWDAERPRIGCAENGKLYWARLGGEAGC